MLAATREILLAKLLALPELIDAYLRNEADFASRSASWLQELEQLLMHLRSPLALGKAEKTLTSRIAEIGDLIDFLETLNIILDSDRLRLINLDQLTDSPKS